MAEIAKHRQRGGRDGDGVKRVTARNVAFTAVPCQEISCRVGQMVAMQLFLTIFNGNDGQHEG